MAIYHFSVKIISRGQGRSVIAAAAYRAGERLRDHHLGQWQNYTRKQGVVHRAILLPVGAPEAWADRATLWNAVEAAERRRDAQLARELEIALPRELSKRAAIRLAEDFVRRECVARGMVADIAIHWVQGSDGQPQPHAHILLTLRGVEGGGFGPKRREWNATALLQHWREAWADLANACLAENGHDVRIDHRSLETLGLDLMPQVKLGAGVRRREAAGKVTERGARARDDRAFNGDKLLADPTMALAAITAQQSTFTRRDIARFINGHTVDAEQFRNVLARVMALPALVRLGRDSRGEERYTTKEMLALESGLAATAEALAQERHKFVDPTLCRRHAEAARLGEEQTLALGRITGATRLAAVVGHAGTGKSTLLGAARAVWDAAGYRVRGAALSGIAAEGLQQGAGIESRTIASLLRQWGQGRETLSARDVLVVDEAGMVGSRDLAAVLAAVQAAGAKLVLVGDAEQLQPIAAGAPFRAIVERVGAEALTVVRRQKQDWQRQATAELATGQTRAALARYQEKGMVLASIKAEEAKIRLIIDWQAGRRRDPAASRIILAHRRADVRDLNDRARAVRRERGELGPDVMLPTRDGKKPFAAGERIYFLRNERSLGVKNGTLGTLVAIEGAGAGTHLKVRLDSGREVVFALKDYDALDHGYAATMHKAQGVTVDHAHVLLSASMDRHLTYVALSRHRESVRLHWSEEEMGNSARMAERLARARRKESTLDYEPAAVSIGVGFAVRRGLAPESAILVPEARPAPPRAMPQPAAAMAKAPPVPEPKPAPKPKAPTRLPPANSARRRQPSFYDVAANAVEWAAAAAWEGVRTQAAFVTARLAEAGQRLGQALVATAKAAMAKPPAAPEKAKVPAKPVAKAQSAQSMVKAATTAKLPSKAPAASSATSSAKSSPEVSAPSRQAPGSAASSPQLQRLQPVAEPAPKPPAAPHLAPRPELRPAPPAAQPVRPQVSQRVPEAEAPAARRMQTPGAARGAEIFVPHRDDKIIAQARGKIPQPRPEPEPTPEPELEPPSMGMGMG
ncbi:Ti-type conjugative transfer relaxase TraA [Acidibrevibacterium fodinaquatile]|uniref:Ti-type conjugative transfer relaxase TraA n=1 Tax=Acidibrevibacterium fodinaquatile TaxID=1969806 RepID=UPI000E0D7866|nr:Ti-type conjugative transfer relaxase TraA [Acidibrevibacterium fodinaquatile]